MATIFVGVTDYDWYRYLRDKHYTEVNFWKPNPGTFRVLMEGELFLFKLRKPYGDKVVGGGRFVKSISSMPVSDAWERFGDKNGAVSLEAVRTRIDDCRHNDSPSTGELFIGTRLLTDVFYLDERDWFLIPDWPPQAVQGKSYDTSEPVGEFLWERVRGYL